MNFCPDCPTLPPGVEAALVSVRPSTPETYKGVVPETQHILDIHIECTAQLEVVVVRSRNPKVEVGSTEQFAIARKNRNPAEIRQAIADCPGARKGCVAQWLGEKGTCGAARPIYVKHVTFNPND